MPKIISDHYEQLYTNKMNNLEEIDRFLEMHNLSRLNQKEKENINRWNGSNEIKLLIFLKKTSSRTKVWDKTASLASTKHLKKSYSILLKQFQKIEEGMLPNSFYKTRTTLIPKPDKDTTIQKKTAKISDEYRCKNSIKYWQIKFTSTLKKIIHYDRMGFIRGI